MTDNTKRSRGRPRLIDPGQSQAVHVMVDIDTAARFRELCRYYGMTQRLTFAHIVDTAYREMQEAGG